MDESLEIYLINNQQQMIREVIISNYNIDNIEGTTYDIILIHSYNVYILCTIVCTHLTYIS